MSETTRPASVLAIDDEKNVLAALRRAMLEVLGLEIETTTDPREALHILRERPPTVLISDFSMPVMDGITVLSEARRIAPNTVRILLTARAEREHVIEAINRGRIFRFVTKPWDNEELAAIVTEAFEAHEVQNRSHTGSLDAERERRELLSKVKGVRTMQRSYLPDAELRLATGTAAAFAAPCEYATGDYVDIIPLGDGKTALVLGDVAGHGLEAALFGFATRTMLRSGFMEQDGLGQTIERINRALERESKNGRFMTLFAGVHDAARETLSYVNAGHMAPIVRTEGKLVELNSTGLPLGLLEETTYPEICVPFQPDDLLVAYTDGVSEARNRAAEFFGTERVLEQVQRTESESPAHVLDALRAAVYDFADGAWIQDDLSLLAYRVAARTETGKHSAPEQANPERVS